MISDPTRLSAWRTSPRRFFAAALVPALILAGASCFAARLLEPEHGARWIWAEGDYGGGEPISFYAVRDVELPAAVSGRVTIAADETYLLYLNGQRIGSGSYRSEAPLDVYDVDDFLEVGLNRILVELRSSRGAGGLLAELELGDDTAVVTDDSWRIFRHHDDGVVRGWSNLEGGEAPKIWALAPTGRWRLNGTRHRRIPFQTFPPPERSQPERHRLYHDTSWSTLDASQRNIPALGPQQIFDWGAEVEGYLSFDLRSDEGKPGLLYFSNELPDATKRPPDAVIIPVPGRRWWQDAHSRRFRYALVVGAEPQSRIEVDLLDGETTHPAALPTANHDGVFGIEPPRSYSRVEEGVWKRLEGEAAERASNGG